MRTGDVKQAVILSVVALAALVFLGVRVPPRGSSLLPMLGGAPRETVSATLPTGESLPLALVGNPFSHPKLAPPQQRPAAANPRPDIDKSGGFAPMAVDELPNPNGRPTSDPPEESAGIARQQEQEPRISLNAIMRVEGPVALLSLNRGKAELHKSGDELTKGVRLVDIGQTEVTLSVFGRKRVLQVGGSLGNSEKQ